MKRNLKLKFAALALLGFALSVPAVSGQTSIISSLSHNGHLGISNLLPGSIASVEWAPSLSGPWTNSWKGLESVTADSSGNIQVSVPMFYRVRGTPTPPAGRVTFTKWATAFPNQPGLIATMAGVVGGDVGTGAYVGEALKMGTDAATGITEIVAFYRFNGPIHSFTALVRVLQTGSDVGSKAVIDGVITDGWMKGHAMEGEYTQIAIDHDGGTGYQGSFEIH